MDKIDIAVRVYNKLKDGQEKSANDNSRPENNIQYERYMTIDTECRSTQEQALTFLSYVIRNKGTLESVGLAYAPDELTALELQELQSYCRKNKFVKLLTLDDFMAQVFYPNLYTSQIPGIFFNGPFDIARMASGFGYARGVWEHGGFTFKLLRDNGANKKYPHIKVRKLDSSDSTMNFQGSRYSSFKGNLIDCQKLVVILTDRKRISLGEACRIFNKKYFKSEADGHGTINERYIDYNINDTLCTAELFTHLIEEYEKYEIKMPIGELYSSASLSKKFLENLGIVPFMRQNPNFSHVMLGKLASSYAGARSECRKRKIPVKVTVLDFTSQYPSLNILLGLYDFLIAERIDYFDDTLNVQRLIDNIKLEDLRNPEIWKTLMVLIELSPEEDLVWSRAEYNKDSFTVGLNYLTCKKPLYYGLPSIILSKLLTGKTPKIKSAIRFVPVGKQKTLKTARILGMEVDPNVQNIFKLLVEERHRCKKAGDKREKCIKILVNSNSYGIGMELNRQPEKEKLVVYSGNEVFEDFKCYEKEGKYYNVILAAFITDAAKLLLGLGDCILQKHNEVMAYCDTDSMFVPPEYANEVVEFFDSLNPYSNVEHFLKIEEKELWFYGISAKRYVLYNIDGQGNFIIKDDAGNENYSLHGLGHLSNPFGNKTKNWQKEIWLDILKLHYNKITNSEFLDKYKNFYAVSQFTVSTANLMRRFKLLNRDKKYSKMIKPFNFFLIGFSNREDVKPIAPYSKDSQVLPYGKFINYKNGKIMQGQEYFKNLADELWAYVNHPESKLGGNIGTLQRRHILVDKIIYIGKEADRLEENISGLSNINYNTYTNSKEVEKALMLEWREVKSCGISKKQFYRLRKRLREGKALHLSRKTLKRLRSLSEFA